MNQKAFITRLDKILRNSLEKGYTDRELIFSRVVKLGEEYGELCEHIMTSVGHGRDDKIEKFDHQDLAREFADVYLVLLLTARAAGVNMQQAIKMKMDTLEKRFTA